MDQKASSSRDGLLSIGEPFSGLAGPVKAIRRSLAPMYDPAHPGESLRDAMDAEEWTVTEASAKLGCTRQTFSRLLNGRHIAGYGVGTHRLEQRRFLGAAAGALRTGTRAFAPAEIARMTRFGGAVKQSAEHSPLVPPSVWVT